MVTVVLLSRAYSRVLYWAAVHGLVRYLAEKLQLARAMDTNSVLEKFQELCYLVERMMELFLDDLSISVPLMPSMADAYKNLPTKDFDFDAKFTVVTADLKTTEDAALLKRVHRTCQLVCSETLRSKHNIHSAVEELHTLADVDIDGERHFTALVTDQITELAVISEVRHQLTLLEPYRSRWAVLESDAASNHCSVLAYTETKIHRCVSKYCLENGAKQISPELEYPDEPETMSHDGASASIEQRRKAEIAVDDFFQGLHDSMSQLRDPSTAHTDNTVLIELYRIRPVWIGEQRLPVAGDSQIVKPAFPEDSTVAEVPQNEAAEPHSTITEGMRSLSMGTSMTSAQPSRYTPTGPPRKQRRRDILAVAEEQQQAAPQAGGENTPRPIYSVDQEAFDVFDAAFSITKDRKPGQIRWTSLLHAMREAFDCTAEHTADVTWHFVRNRQLLMTLHQAHGNTLSRGEMLGFKMRLGRSMDVDKESFVLRN